MTVGAEQHTFARFRSTGVEASREAAGGQTERLGGRVDVMELKRGERAVVSADQTTASGLLDEDLLDAAPSSVHPLPTASRATPVTVLLEPELGVAVVHAHPADRALTHIASSLRLGPQ